MKSIDDYKVIFEKNGKMDFFEINQPFLERMIATKKNIDDLSTKKLVFEHPVHPNIQKTSENAKLLLKLEQLYKDQTVALNKILGNNSEEPNNPFPEEDDD